MSQFARTALLIGDQAIDRLKNAHVAVLGVGGVGGACTEALARAGVGQISLFDADTVSLSNINRQIIALHSTVGQPKVEVLRSRILDIHPEAVVHAHAVFYSAENAADYPLDPYDYIVDAIDTVTSKALLIELAYQKNIPIISCMGAGNKLDATRFEVSDLYATSVCPLAKAMRGILKKRGVPALKVVYSKEEPLKPQQVHTEHGRHLPGSMPYVPPVAGMIAAGEVIKDLCCLHRQSPA